MKANRANFLAVGTAMALAAGCGGGEKASKIHTRATQAPTHSAANTSTEAKPKPVRHHKRAIAYVSNAKMEALLRPAAVKVATKAVELASNLPQNVTEHTSTTRAGQVALTLEFNNSAVSHGPSHDCEDDIITTFMSRDSDGNLDPATVNKVKLSMFYQRCDTANASNFLGYSTDAIFGPTQLYAGLRQWNGRIWESGDGLADDLVEGTAPRGGSVGDRINNAQDVAQQTSSDLKQISHDIQHPLIIDQCYQSDLC